MPTDQPINPDDSNVELSELESDDEVTVVYRDSSGTRGEFDATVTRASTFDSGTEISLTQNAKIYGDFYPPIVRTPEGDELRLYTINRN